MDSDSFVKLFVAIILVLLNAFFVAAEFSIVKVRYSQIQIKAAEGNLLAKQAERIIGSLDAYLSATQLGITLSSLALGWIGKDAFNYFFEHVFTYFSIVSQQDSLAAISLVCSFFLITVMHLVFGELIPKSIAIRKAESTTLIISYPLILFYNVFRPFIWLINNLSGFFLKIIKIHPASEYEIHSTEELQFLVKQSADSGRIEEEDYEIIKNAFSFTDLCAKQIMIPRQNIFSIDINQSNQEILEKILESGYSRLPVYQDSIDNIIGIFYTKEFIREYIKNKNNYDSFDIRSLIHEALFVIETKKISDLLKSFQQKKQHIAVVIDEFGGTEGIITLEDILEELVGEIQDEEDDDEGNIVDKTADNTYCVKATQPLDEINEYLPEPLSGEGEYNTLSGFILHKLSEIPEENQEFTLENYRFRILKMQKKGVELVELIYAGSEAIAEPLNCENSSKHS